MVLFNVVDIVWGLLIYIIVYPIAKQQVGMCSPRYEWWLRGIVVGVIMLRKRYICALSPVAFKLRIKGIGRVFKVSHDEKLASATRHHHAHTAIFRLNYKR